MLLGSLEFGWSMILTLVFCQKKHVGLTLCIIEAMGLDVGTVTPKWTPAEAAAAPLVKDSEGAQATGTFSYSSVVGMLLYLSGHTCPDIAYAVNCAARYMFCPKKSHEEALKHIWQVSESYS